MGTTKPKNDISAEFVRSILNYEPLTGHLYWKVNRPPRAKRGNIAGCRKGDGYIVIGIGGRMYLGHRLAWLIVTGKWPENQIDHISGDTTDDRWVNLREATHAQNLQNHKLRKNNTSGFKGVYRHTDGYWGAMIQVNRKKIHLGLFKKIHDAANAYRVASEKYHGTFSRY